VRNNAGPNGEDAVTIETRHAFVPKNPESYTYDADGNLTGDGRWLYSWDGENRLSSMQTNPNAVAVGVPNTRIQFTYDAQGRRIEKKVYTTDPTSGLSSLASDLLYAYDGWNCLADLNPALSSSNGSQLSTFNPVCTYTWGLDLSGSTQGASGVGGLLFAGLTFNSQLSTCYYSYDGNGNVISLTSASDGMPSAQYDYNAFGERLVSRGPMAEMNKYRFSTKPQDAESGLYYYGKRYYNLSNSKWLNRDPLGESGGINIYAFCNNDSINTYDPLGLQNPPTLTFTVVKSDPGTYGQFTWEIQWAVNGSANAKNGGQIAQDINYEVNVTDCAGNQISNVTQSVSYTELWRILPGSMNVDGFAYMNNDSPSGYSNGDKDFFSGAAFPKCSQGTITVTGVARYYSNQAPPDPLWSTGDQGNGTYSADLLSQSQDPGWPVNGTTSNTVTRTVVVTWSGCSTTAGTDTMNITTSP
jgi:RHS repeat-associated protein